jgi:SAM-dependent methyltransferase
VLNFENVLLAPLDTVKLNTHAPRVLIIDGKMGTPVLETRNHLKRRGITAAASWAFTTQAKYFTDLQTVAEDVKCDRIDFIQDCYANDRFDVIVSCEPINAYSAPMAILRKLCHLLKPRGALLFKLRNTEDFRAFMRAARLGGQVEMDTYAGVSLDQMIHHLQTLGVAEVTVNSELEGLSQKELETIQGWLKALKGAVQNDDLARICTRNYCVCVTNGEGV